MRSASMAAVMIRIVSRDEAAMLSRVGVPLWNGVWERSPTPTARYDPCRSASQLLELARFSGSGLLFGLLDKLLGLWASRESLMSLVTEPSVIPS